MTSQPCAEPPVPLLDADELLLTRIADSDEAAFRQLVERHVDRAYALALRILRNAADADSVAQEVMLKVWTQRNAWQAGPARFSILLCREVVARCGDAHRRTRPEAVAELPLGADGRPGAVDIQPVGVATRLDQAMALLPELERIALILSYADLRHPEIADILEITVAAVESLLARGRRQLRQDLRTTPNGRPDSLSGN